MPLFRVDATAAVAAALVTLPCLAADLLVPQQFGTIQEAVNAAAGGDRVLVSAGTYHEQVNLSGKGIQLIGVDGAAVTAIDGDNSRTVMVGNGEPSTCLVQGLTIQNGRDSGTQSCGGVRINNSSVHFEDCRFVSNRSVDGAFWGAGAFRSEFGNPKVSRCIFSGNSSVYEQSTLYHYQGGSILIEDCLFTDNSAGMGRAIQIQSEGGAVSAQVKNCIFRRNESRGERHCEVLGFNPNTVITVEDCVTDSAKVSASNNPSLSGFAVAWNGAHITLRNISACGFPALTDSISVNAWSDGGGNTLTANCCPADLDSDGEIGGADISLVLLEFGDCLGCKSDLDGSGETNGGDLSALLLDYGSCQ